MRNRSAHRASWRAQVQVGQPPGCEVDVGPGSIDEPPRQRLARLTAHDSADRWSIEVLDHPRAARIVKAGHHSARRSPRH